MVASPFRQGRSLREAAPALSDLVSGSIEPDGIAGYVMIIVPTEAEGGAPIISASQNLDPEFAAHVLITGGVVLAATVVQREQN